MTTNTDTQAGGVDAVKPFDLRNLLRDAFLSGRGLKGDAFLSDEDQAAWAAYEPGPPRAYARVTAALAASPAAPAERPAGHVEIAHDGFSGDIIGHYETRDGKRGVVVQQDGTRVVHVYGEKWLAAPAKGER